MKTAAKALTALAAGAMAVSAYSTLPEGRALTEQEKMGARGLAVPGPGFTAASYACSTCDGPEASCTAKLQYPSEGAQWVPNDPTIWKNCCDGTKGRKSKYVGANATTGATEYTWDCINNTFIVSAKWIDSEPNGYWKYTWVIDGLAAKRSGCGQFVVCTTYPNAGCGSE